MNKLLGNAEAHVRRASRPPSTKQRRTRDTRTLEEKKNEHVEKSKFSKKIVSMHIFYRIVIKKREREREREEDPK